MNSDLNMEQAHLRSARHVKATDSTVIVQRISLRHRLITLWSRRDGISGGRLVFLFIAAVGVLLLHSAGERYWITRTAGAERWSHPTRFDSLPDGWFLDKPSLAFAESDSWYIVGTPRPMPLPSGEITSARRPLVISGMTGDSVGPPAGDYQYLRPIMIGTGVDMHLFWGEADSTRKITLHDQERLRPGSLWHAQYIDGVGWSPAELILTRSDRNSSLRWTDQAIGIAVDSSLGVHLVIPTLGVRSAMLHLYRDIDGWHRDSISTGGLYSGIAAGPRNHLYVAYVGRNASVDRAGNDVVFLLGPRWTPREGGSGPRYEKM